MDIEIRLLEYFLAVCEELHFTRAAEKLNITQPTLSHQIQLLEKRLNTQLFERNGKKIYMTESGNILKKHAQQVFYELEQAEIAIAELNGFQRGKITIGCSGNYLLHSAIATFHNKYPKIKLSVIDTTTEDTVEKIMTNQFDMGLVYLPVTNKLLEVEKLFSSELCLIVSCQHEFASLEVIDLEQLEGAPIFLLQDKFLIRQVIDHSFAEIGYSLNPIVELSDMHSLIQMTILNNGITILPFIYMGAVNDERIRTVSIKQLPKKDVGLVYRKNTSKTVKVFIEHLIENFHRT